MTVAVAEKALRETLHYSRGQSPVPWPEAAGPQAKPKAVLPSRPTRPAEEPPF